MNESPARLVLSVVVTCAVASGALGATYLATRDRIAEQNKIAEERSLQSAFASAEEFRPLDDTETLELAQEAAGEPQVQGVFEALVGGTESGWAVKVAPRGYGGRIEMIVALDRNGKVVGVSILSMNETPGLGTQTREPSFLEQFVGWSADSIDADAETLDAVSGATKSSRGVTKGVVAAGHVYEQVLKEEVSAQ